MLLRIISFLFESKKKRFLSFCVMGTLVFLASNQNGMFWDNVLFASKMGNQLYYNSIFDWTMPDSFDPGHPPFLAFLLAASWKVFGHTLLVSHLVILPFTIGFFYQLFKFISYFIEGIQLQFFAFLLIIIDPTVSTAFVLVNPEIIIIFFFFLTINGILFKSKLQKIIGLLFLSIVTFRSMMLFGGIFIFEMCNHFLLEKKKFKLLLNLKFLLPYILGSFPGVVFVVWRLSTKGWLQTHPDSPWAGYWHFADFEFFIRNCIVLIWRYLDFGRIFIFLFLSSSLLFFGKKVFQSKKNKQLILLAITSVLFIVITVLIATNAFGHRYFIVSYILLILLAFKILQKLYNEKKLMYSFLFIGLLTGNLWMYPKNLSQGWNATLGHLPYHSLRIEAIDYLNENNINIEEVSSFFPNYNVLDFIDFKGDKRSFAKFKTNKKYVFYASVYNLTDDEQKSLANHYTVLKQFHKFNTTIKIYILKRP
ncbi:MAG: hypothetical protein P8I51_05330 [Polaribacter sp.]|jgi:hypothetical protein|nr:hypothetical protein [Polaribacter sp.]MDG1954304.1 hypothetical protein [Polaribacter sp.]MDG2074717.1 hypothetical protein [Polaribacter sp.]